MLSVGLLLALTFIFVSVALFLEGNAWLGIISLILGISMIAVRYGSRRKQKKTDYIYLNSTDFSNDYGRAADELGRGEGRNGRARLRPEAAILIWGHSTTRVGFMATALETLEKFGEVAMTIL